MLKEIYTLRSFFGDKCLGVGGFISAAAELKSLVAADPIDYLSLWFRIPLC